MNRIFNQKLYTLFLLISSMSNRRIVQGENAIKRQSERINIATKAENICM